MKLAVRTACGESVVSIAVRPRKPAIIGKLVHHEDPHVDVAAFRLDCIDTPNGDNGVGS